MVVPKPPVVPVRRMGEAGDAISAFDGRDKIDRKVRAESSGCISFERFRQTQRETPFYVCLRSQLRLDVGTRACLPIPLNTNESRTTCLACMSPLRVHSSTPSSHSSVR